MGFNLKIPKLFWVLTMTTIIISSNIAAVNAQDAELSTTNKESQALSYVSGVVQSTQNGKVQGIKEGRTFIWFDIPYAKAPVGERRWKAPQDTENWEGIFDATQNRHDAIQLTNNAIKGSEDCLRLNIYRPATDSKNLPVLMFIHGGNNQVGSKMDLSPTKLAVNANCIVITIDYRLDLLGFNNLPALKTSDPLEDSGNYALLDIAKSLDWIKENAVSFGGNPDSITISGFSAGGRDVMASLISPIMKGKFQKAIAFSGGMTVTDPNDSRKVIAKKLAKLVVEDKIKPTEDAAFEWLQQDTDDVKAYLYNLSANRIVSVMGEALIRMSGFPHLYADGTVLPKDGFATKVYNQVPLIMLTGSGEFSSFTSRDPYFSSALKSGKLLADAKIYNQFRFATDYGSKFYELFNAEESANKMISNYKAPIYTCDILWGNDKKIVGNEMAELVGPTHGIFLPFLTNEDIGPRKEYPESFKNNGAKDLTEKFQNYIANFIRTGNPNGPGLPQWESWKYSPKGPSQLLFDADKDKAIIKMSYTHTSYKDILQQLESDQSISPEEKNIIITRVLNGRWFSSQFDQYFNNQSLWIK